MRGSSISDFVDAEGYSGRLSAAHKVYGREGEKCFRCGAKIRRIIVAGRSSHFCPACQRAPRRVQLAQKKMKRARVDARRRDSSIFQTGTRTGNVWCGMFRKRRQQGLPAVGRLPHSKREGEDALQSSGGVVMRDDADGVAGCGDLRRRTIPVDLRQRTRRS